MMTDDLCIYSLPDDRHDTDGSCAHIIPSAIGGRKASTAIVCSRCNGLTNNRIEKPFVAHFALFNSLLAITPGRKRAVPRLRGLQAENGKKYDIRPGGFPEESKPEVIEHVDADGIVQRIELRGYSERELRRIMKSLRMKYPDLQLVNIRRQPSDNEIRFSQQLQFGHETRRTVAKMGFEYLAAHVKREYILDSAFDAARRFILDGKDEDLCLVFYDDQQIRPAELLGSVDHSIIVVCSHKLGTVCAFVTLYGGLRLTVLLARSWDGPTVGYEHWVDPLTRKQEERELLELPVLSLDHVLARFRADMDDPPRRWAMAAQAFNHILATAERRRPSLARRDAVTKALEEGLWSEEGNMVTQEDWDRVAAHLVDTITGWIRQGS